VLQGCDLALTVPLHETPLSPQLSPSHGSLKGPLSSSPRVPTGSSSTIAVAYLQSRTQSPPYAFELPDLPPEGLDTSGLTIFLDPSLFRVPRSDQRFYLDLSTRLVEYGNVTLLSDRVLVQSRANFCGHFPPSFRFCSSPISPCVEGSCPLRGPSGFPLIAGLFHGSHFPRLTCQFSL